jgi:membrane-associated phospholipid phosphatase
MLVRRRRRVSANGQTHQYLQIVCSAREGARVRQRVVGTFGRGDELVASGQPDGLLRSLSTFGEELAVVEKARPSTLEAEWIKHDCWPSGHTALSLACLVLAKREGSKAFGLLLVPVILLVFSTMYLRYHYVTDVIFGVGLTWVSLRLGTRMHRARYAEGSVERDR